MYHDFDHKRRILFDFAIIYAYLGAGKIKKI
jgi:hypothetical protein